MGLYSAFSRRLKVIYNYLETFFFKGQVLFGLSYFLHWFLVAIHIGLVYFQLHPLHPYIISDFRTADAISIAMTSVPTAIFKIYAIVLIYMTQKLAFSRDFRAAVAVPVYSDKCDAWLGIGTSITTLLSQRRVKTAPWAILGIAVYLACIFVLGLTSPALVRVAQVDLNQTLYTHTTYFLSMVEPSDLVEAYPIISLLPMVGGPMDTYGVDGNTIYDITQSGGEGTINVSAVYFNVDCKYIDGLQQSNSAPYRVQNGTIQYACHVDDNLQDIYISPANRSANIVTAQPVDAQMAPPLTMFVASTLQITDRSGAILSTVQYAPGIAGADIYGNDSSSGPLTLQIAACDVYVTNGTVLIGADDDFLISSPGTTPKYWSAWNLTQAPRSAPVAGLAEFPALSPLSDEPQIQMLENGLSGVFNATMLEDNVMDWQGFYDPEVTHFPLIRLEEALEEALAMVYWRAASRISIRDLASELDQESEQPQFGLQIQINKYTPSIGLVFATILAISSMFLVGLPRKEEIIERPNLIRMLASYGHGDDDEGGGEKGPAPEHWSHRDKLRLRYGHLKIGVGKNSFNLLDGARSPEV